MIAATLRAASTKPAELHVRERSSQLSWRWTLDRRR